MLKLFKNSITLLMRLLVFVLCGGVFFLLMGQKYFFLLRLSRTAAVTAVSFGIVYLLMTRVYGGYDIGVRKSKPIIFSLSLTLLFADLVAHLMFCIMNVTVVHFGRFVYEYPGRLLLIYVLQVAIVIVAAYAGNGLYFRINPPQHCLIITDRGENAADLVKKVGRFKKQYRIEGIAYYDQEDITALIDGCDAVFLYNLEPVKRSRIVSYCYQNWKVIYYSIEPEDVVSLGSQRLLFDDKSMICASSRELTFEQRVLKRLMDIIVSAIGLVIASPIMLVTALAIKLEDRGPVFYKQKRCTKNGEVFEILKFRSMIVDAEKGGKSIPCRSGDPRITRVGRVIRKLRIDEFPQIINVLKGDMSIVGPRPERIEHVEEYTKEIPEFSYRLRVKGGLTGYAQIYGKYNTSPYDKLRLDLQYIEKQSILLDLKLILLTIKIMFVPESTEGFTEEKSAQMTEKTKSINEIEE